MFSKSFKSFFATAPILAGLLSSTYADGVNGPFRICTKNTCDDCPAAISSAGTGYPNCVIYNSEDVFKDQGFEGIEGGSGYHAYFDVEEPGFDCKTIIRSPASTDIVNCGKVLAAYPHATCGDLPVKKTFMVQWCCGDVCDNVRPRSKAIRGVDYRRSPSGAAALRINVNGTEIEPIEVGPPKKVQPEDLSNVLSDALPASNVGKRSQVNKRTKCKKNSWIAKPGYGDYTKAADNTQLVYEQTVSGGTAGSKVTITKTREQSWTVSSGMEFGLADILSFGMSFEVSKEESISDSKSVEFTVPPGSTGVVGFTSYLQCAQGSVECDGERTEEFEFCQGDKTSEGDLKGEFGVIAES